MKIGDFEIVSLSDGWFRLDGGAMFGIIPKVLWARRIVPDERNRIRLGLRPLLVRTPEGELIIDTGIGSEWTEKEKDIYAVEHPPDLSASIEAAGTDRSGIDYVIITHLHFDHAGGNTVLDSDGRRSPAFPRARYLIQEREWLSALKPGERSRASYRESDFIPLETAGAVERVHGETEVLPGVRLVPTAGHTGGHQSVVIESKGEGAVFFGDTVPTSAHVDPAWVMGYDLFPQETVDRKKELLALCADRGYLAVFEHDPSAPFYAIRRGKKGFEAEAA